MTIPSLYKYLDVNGAKLTLKNGTFKHAKPSSFNDIEDLSVQSLFPQDIDRVCQEIEDIFLNVLLDNIDREWMP